MPHKETVYAYYAIIITIRCSTRSRFTTMINRSSRRKRGMASRPLFIIPDFFFIFQTNFAMATLGLKEMGKFKPKVAIAEFFWKMQRKTWYSILGLDDKPLSTKLGMLRVETIYGNIVISC